jgi:hypothetical protein
MHFKCSVLTTERSDAHGSEKDLPKHGTSSADKRWIDLSFSEACFWRQDSAVDNSYESFPNKMFPKLILTMHKHFHLKYRDL